MVEYKSLKVAIFEDERFSGFSCGINGLSTRLAGYVLGIFKTAKIYGAMDHAPGQIQSFHNPKDFDSLDELKLLYPNLAVQVEEMSKDKARRVRDIRVYEAQLLDERVLGAFNGLPHSVTIENSENQLARDPMRPVLLVRG